MGVSKLLTTSEVSRSKDENLDLEGRLIRSEKREPVPLFDLQVQRSDEIMVVCSWCKKMKAKDQWVEVETGVERLGLFNHSLLPQISHGLCESCAEQVFGTATA